MQHFEQDCSYGCHTVLVERGFLKGEETPNLAMQILFLAQLNAQAESAT